MIKKISQLLIMTGKYLMIIGITIIILSWLFPYKASAMVNVTPRSAVACANGACAIPVILDCSPVENAVNIGIFDTTGTLQYLGNCMADLNSDYSTYIDWVLPSLGGSGSSTIVACNNEIDINNTCDGSTDITYWRNSAGFEGEVTFTILEKAIAGGFFHFTSPTTGEISNSPSDLMANVGTVSTDTFKSSLPYVLVFMGVSIAFYILSSLNRVVTDNNKGLKYTKPKEIFDKSGKRIGYDTTGDGYKRIVNKKGQISGYMKE